MSDDLIPLDEHRRLRRLHRESSVVNLVYREPAEDQYGRPVPRGSATTCIACGQPWPCETIRMLDADIARREGPSVAELERALLLRLTGVVMELVESIDADEYAHRWQQPTLRDLRALVDALS